MSNSKLLLEERFIRRFFAQLYDEWITGVDNSDVSTVEARTCRALSGAIGEEKFESILKTLSYKGCIVVLCSFKNAEPETKVIELLDYSI